MKKAVVSVFRVRSGIAVFFSYHEIPPADDAWKTSSRVNNGQRLVADDMDGHLPVSFLGHGGREAGSPRARNSSAKIPFFRKSERIFRNYFG